MAGAIAVYRLAVDPLIASTLSLGAHASSVVRRVNIFAITVLAYWAWVRYAERRPAMELALRWSWFPAAAAAGAISIGVTILTLYATGHYQLVSFRGFDSAAGILGLIWIAAVIEEVTFRGILFRLVEERVGTTAAWGGTAALFTISHLMNNGVHWVTLLSVTLAGFMWAGIFVVWRNLWIVAIHQCCWNAAIFLSGAPLSGEDWRSQAPIASVAHGSVLWTGGAFGPEDSLINVAVSIAICAALWHLARRRGLLLPIPTP